MATEVGVRDLRLPADANAILAIDTSYVSDVTWTVTPEASGLRIGPRTSREPHRHRSDVLAAELTRTQRPWSQGFVAVSDGDGDGDGEIIGFVATGLETWNRRLRVWHLYVSPGHRRRGVARQLLATVTSLGHQLDAGHVFVETSNVNGPAIAAYQRLGMDIVGFDSSLYDATPAQGEVAVYLARRL